MNYPFYIPEMRQPNPDERVWVQGEDAAKAYLVTPNGFVRLWDSTKPIFYEKRTDPSGRPYMESYKYERIDLPKTSENFTEKVTELEKRIKELEERYNNAKSNADDSTIQPVQEQF